ncbi:biotin transporter BioY [Streptosporangium lutulentum]|uniref:Biotin transporter n=1 Tax=Streptosporangium lutulentum TaxID=1461250 RepID=A0ABT9QUA9_9ACTN|nr:biotin transporter BioY [Streptosporangium lutulentum]MDP9849873.1 biotin transport system substrate-specific component [Streptosporangium lutulentum]
MPKFRRGSGFPTGDLARVSVFAALIAVLGLPGALNVFGNAVPITLQTFGVMLAGAILGTWRAALAIVVLLVLVAAGLPLLAGGRGGLGVFVGPSAGFLLGWLPGAALTGWIVERGGRSPGIARLLTACLAGGVGMIYLVGIPVQAAVAGISLGQAALLSVAFLPGDAIKAILASIVVRGTQRAYPDAIPAVHRERLSAARKG